MRRWLILALAVTCAIIPLALVAGGDAKAGKAVYDKRCATCHGPQGEGKPAVAKMMKVEMRHLGSKEVQAKTDAQIRKESVEGVGKMKAVKGMSEEEIANLIAFVRSLAKK